MESFSEQADAEAARHATPDGRAADSTPHLTSDAGTHETHEEATSVAAEPSGIPHTGDALIDAAIVELAHVRERPLAERIVAGENAHRVLQSRLNDLGGE